MSKFKKACEKFNGDLIKPYQSDGVRWMIARELDITPGGILCDEMGLGKTAQTICTMLADERFTNTLIVCPKSVVNQWALEIRKFAPSLSKSILIFTGPKRPHDPDDIKKYKVVITTMGTLLPTKRRLVSPAHLVKWHRVVVDEAHDMRNPRSKAYASIWALKARVRWCLTATPVFNKITDFGTLMEWIGVPKVHVQASLRQCVERYTLRRTKSQVSEHNAKLQLPPCDVEEIRVTISEEEKDLYHRVYQKVWASIEEAIEHNAPNIMIHLLSLFLRCRQTLAYPPLVSKTMFREDWEGSTSKMNILVKKLKEHPDEKTLIFCNFRGEMDAIQQACDRKVYRIDGSNDLEDRKRQVREFHEDPTGAIFIIQIKAGGVGLNLQGATRVYINSPSWNPATEVQAIGRAHRTGQTKHVKVYRLITDSVGDKFSSIENDIILLQKAKSVIFEQLVDNVGDMGKLTSVMGASPDLESMRKMFDDSMFRMPTLEQLPEIAQ